MIIKKEYTKLMIVPSFSIFLSLFCMPITHGAPADPKGIAYVSEDREAEFGGELMDLHTIAEGNGMIELSMIDQYNTYVIGGNGQDQSYATTIDTLGNTYITGAFSDTVDFNVTAATDEHTSSGGTDIFLTKINADGTYGYTFAMGGVQDDHGLSIATDQSGNIYLTGSFHGTLDFDPTAGTNNHTSSGGTDIFLTRINADGSYGFTFTMGSAQDDRGQSVSTGTHGMMHMFGMSDSVYITGFFADTVDFDPTVNTDEHTSSGGTDIFLTKIRTDGSYEHTYTFGDSSDDYGNSVVMNEFDEVYLTGSFQGLVDFDPDPTTEDIHSSNGNVAAFLLKLQSGELYEYTQTYDRSEGYDVAVGMTGEVFITGHAWSDTTSSEDIFLAKKSIDGSSDFVSIYGGSGDDRGFSLISDLSGATYITGQFENNADLDPTSSTDQFTSSGGTDIFLTKIASDGSYDYTRTLGGSGDDNGFGVASAIFSDELYVTGSFRDTVDFDVMDGSDVYTSRGNTDLFLTKFTVEGFSAAPSALYRVSGMYQVQVIPSESLDRWQKFTFDQDVPEGTTLMHEILDVSCSFPIAPPTTEHVINVADMRLRDPELCLRTTFMTDDQSISPRLDKWEASYKTMKVK